MRWREGKDLPPGEQRLASPYDLDARYGLKRGHGWTGYKVHLTEACEPDLPHLVTNVETTDATTGDAEMTAVVHQRLGGRGLAPGEHVVDAGYVSARNILAARDDHGITLTGPVGADTTQGQRDNGTGPLLPQDAFKVDWDARKVTCPNGAGRGPAGPAGHEFHRSDPARSGSGRLVGDQHHDLRARPPVQLRPVG